MKAGNPIQSVILISFLLGGFLLCTGCVLVSVDTGSSGDLSPEMDRILNNVTMVLQKGTDDIQTELHAAAASIGEDPQNTENVLRILRSYYVENPWVSLIGYYGVQSEKITVPITPPSTAEALFTSLTEADFSSGNIRMAFNQIQGDAAVPVTAIFVPVYSPQKTYCGAFVIWYDPDRLVGDLLAGQEGMEIYGLWVGDTTGTETYYRTSPDYTGCPESTEYQSGWKTARIFENTMRICLIDDGTVQKQGFRKADASSLRNESISLYSYATSHSQKAVLNYISRMESDQYLYFAYDTRGNVLARSDGRYVNQNHQDLHDAFGVQALDMMVARVRQGGGYMYVMNPTTNAQHPESAVQAVAYLLPIDSSWFIGVQGSVRPEQIPVDSSLSWEVLTFGRETVDYAWKYGQDAAVDLINREESTVLRTADSDKTVFQGAVTMEGVSLPENPDLTVGNRRVFGQVDTYGASVGRQAVALAKQGGGLLYYERIMEDAAGAKTAQLFLFAITPVNDEWYIFTGCRIDTP